MKLHELVLLKSMLESIPTLYSKDLSNLERVLPDLIKVTEAVNKDLEQAKLGIQ